MKTHSISLQSPRHISREKSVSGLNFNTDSLTCLVLAVMISAIPAAALVVFATWATGVPTLLPAVQAATGLAGFIFLALAVESTGPAAVLKVITAIALFSLAYASMAVATEFAIVGTMLTSAWISVGTFQQLRKNCL